MTNELYFLTAKSIDRNNLPIDRAFVSNTEKDRDDIVHALKLSGHPDAKSVSRDEAFAIVEPDANGTRRFNFYGSGDYIRLDADWSPEQTTDRISAAELAREARHAKNDAEWKARFKA